MKDIDIEAMEEACEFERRDADTKLQKMKSEIEDIREESKALGVLQMIKYNNAHNELIKYAMLYQVKKSKEYKKSGMTWQEFCDSLGEPRKTIEDKLSDILPLVEKCSADFASFARVPFNKIRYLGRSVAAESANIDNNALIIDETIIPLTSDNKEEIEAAIDTLIETHKQEKETLQKKLKKHEGRLKENVEEQTKGLMRERDNAIAAMDKYKEEADRLKPFDITEVDIPEVKEFIKQIHDISIKFELAIRKFTNFINDERLNKELKEKLEEDMSSQAEIEKYLFRTYRNIKDLRMEWDDEFYPEDDGGPDFDPFSETNKN